MMKLYTFILALFLISCGSSEDSKEAPPQSTEPNITCQPESLSFPAIGEEEKVKIKSTTAWEATSNSDWCTITPKKGFAGESLVSLKVMPNEGLNERQATITFHSGEYKKEFIVTQGNDEVIFKILPEHLSFESKVEKKELSVLSANTWTVQSSDNWLQVSPQQGDAGETPLIVQVSNNETQEERATTLVFQSNGELYEYEIRQEGVYVPEGYTLVWQDEFTEQTTNGKPALPNTDKWWFETGDHGWGNNELQDYIDRIDGSDTCSVVNNGTLKIIAQKKENRILSIRMNTKEDWTYGYFEARLKLPTGKGTWPAFWMMPTDFSDGWPLCGEIDIMEEVGYRPNWVSSAIHTKKYNHSIQTEKTGEIFLASAQDEFHIYALEWTKDYIRTFVDGKEIFKFENDNQGNKESWPFNKPFYLKLNLAWGGNWGGAQGVDESVLPATYEVDYVRVYQKKN